MKGLALLLLATFAIQAWARPMEPFHVDVFAKDQKNGNRVVVLFYAWWNKYSRDEKSAVQILTEIKAYSALKTYVVDFSDLEVRKKFNVDKVSTMIVFQGEQELGRGVNLADGDAVEELIRKLY